MRLKSLGVRMSPYAMAIALFFLPFIQVSCNDERVSSISGENLLASEPIILTGMQLATGSWQSEPKADHTPPDAPDPFALVALVALVTGLAFSIKSSRILALSSAIAGIVALIALVTLNIAWGSAAFDSLSSEEMFRVHFKPGFWGACVVTTLGIFLALTRFGNAKPRLES